MTYWFKAHHSLTEDNSTIPNTMIGAYISPALKIINNISTCICIRKCNKNGEFSPCHFW